MSELLAESQIQGLVLESLKKLESNGMLAAAVEKQVESTLNSIVKDALCSYSDFGKALTARVKAQAQVDFEKLNLPCYHDILLQAVERIWMESAQETGLNQVMDRLRSLLGNDLKGPYKLSSLVKLMRRDHMGEEWEEHKMSLHIDQKDTIAFIRMDPEEDRATYLCRYSITLWKREAAWHVHGIEVKDENGAKPKRGISLGSSIRSLDSLLVSLYMRDVQIDLDCDEDCEHLFFGRD